MRTLLLLALALLAVGGCRHRHPDPASPAIQRGGVPATPGGETGELSVVSFNVQHRGSAALIRTFQNHRVLRDADVLLLQEMESHPHEGENRALALARALGMQYAYAPRYGVGAGGTHGLAILSRRPLTDVEVIELPTFDLYYNCGRVIALAATVRAAGRSVRVYHTHLDTRITPRERLHQLRPLLERARADAPTPTIVAGDFNSTPFTWFLRRVPFPVAASNAKIERLMGTYDLEMAATEPEGTTRWLNMCVDWIYTRGLSIFEYAVLDRVHLGDHYPLWIRCREAPSGQAPEPPASP